MLLNHIRNEVIRRLHDGVSLPDEAISALGINPTAVPEEPVDPLDPGPAVLDLPGEGEIVRGSVPFEITVSAFGRTETLTFRVRFATTLYDEKDRRTGRPIRILGRTHYGYDLLEWRDPEHRDAQTGDRVRGKAPHWVPVELWPLLSDETERNIDELMEARAVQLEADGKTEA